MSSTSVDDPVVRDSPTAAAGKGSCGGAVAGGVYNSPVEFQGLGRGWEGQWNDIGLDRAVVGAPIRGGSHGYLSHDIKGRERWESGTVGDGAPSPRHPEG